MSLRCGCTWRSKCESETPTEAAASLRVSAKRGTGTSGWAFTAGPRRRDHSHSHSQPPYRGGLFGSGGPGLGVLVGVDGSGGLGTEPGECVKRSRGFSAMIKKALRDQGFDGPEEAAGRDSAGDSQLARRRRIAPKAE